MDTDSPDFHPEALLSEMAWLRALSRGLAGTDGEDVLQETLLAALQHRPKASRSLRPWLATTARRFSARIRRRDQARRAGEVAAGKHEVVEPPGSDLVAKAEMQQFVVHQVVTLCEPYRTTLLLRFMEQLSYEAIGARTNVGIETVRTRVKRGLALVRDRMSQQYGADWRQTPAFASLLAPFTTDGTHPCEPLSKPENRAPARPVQSTSTLLATGCFLAVGIVALVLDQSIACEPETSWAVAALESTETGSDRVAADQTASARPGNTERTLQPTSEEAVILQTLEGARRIGELAGDVGWPGFTIDAIPIAIYGRSQRVWLVHHPRPPKNYRKLSTDLVTTPVFTGPPTAAMRANYAARLDGIPTAMIDAAYLGNEVSGRGIALVLRTAAHVFRRRSFKANRWPNENPLTVGAYPTTDPINNAWGRIEGLALREALESTPGEWQASAIHDFLTARRHRHQRLTEDLRNFETGVELNEGIPDFLALKMFMAVHPGHGAVQNLLETEYGPSGDRYDQLVRDLSRVNLSGFGASRQRFHATGTAQALLLQSLVPEWRRLVEREHRLDELLEKHTTVDPLPAQARLAALRHRFDLPSIIRQEREAGRARELRDQRSLLDAIGTIGPCLVVDLTAVAESREITFFDPANLIATTSGLVVHQRIVRFGFSCGHAEFAQPVAAHDQQGYLLTRIPSGLSVFARGNRIEHGSGLHRGRIVANAKGIDIVATGWVQWDKDVIIVRPEPRRGRYPEPPTIPFRKAIANLRRALSQPEPAPRTLASDFAGKNIELSSTDGREVGILFMTADPSCADYGEPSLSALQRACSPNSPRLIVVLTDCPHEAIGRYLPGLCNQPSVIHEASPRLKECFGVRTLPTLVWVDSTGTVTERRELHTSRDLLRAIEKHDR